MDWYSNSPSLVGSLFIDCLNRRCRMSAKALIRLLLVPVMCDDIISSSTSSSPRMRLVAVDRVLFSDASFWSPTSVFASVWDTSSKNCSSFDDWDDASDFWDLGFLLECLSTKLPLADNSSRDASFVTSLIPCHTSFLAISFTSWSSSNSSSIQVMIKSTKLGLDSFLSSSLATWCCMAIIPRELTLIHVSQPISNPLIPVKNALNGYFLTKLFSSA